MAVKKRVKVLLGLLAIFVAGCLLGGGQLWGQAASATLEGVITDNGGEPLPGATVHLRNVASGFTHDALSRPNGTYVLSGVIPGTYEIEVSLTGFTSQIRKDVVLAVGARFNIDFALAPESLNTEVKVTAEAPMIEVTKSDLSAVVNREMIESLPLLNRDFSDLSVLKAGVMEGVANAQPYGSGEMMVDGVSNEDVMQNDLGTMIPADAIQEFRVITNQAMAEFGNMSGLVTTAITRSGTNKLQGRLSYFYRDEAFDTPNYFVNHAEYQGPELPKDQWDKAPYSHGNISGFLGGPIIKDKAHFFITYERLDVKNYATIVTPLAPRETVPQKSSSDNILAKFSYQLNRSNQFSLRLQMAPERYTNQGIGGIYTKERGANGRSKYFSAVGEWTSFPSAKTMNEFRAYYSRGRYWADPVIETYTIDRPGGYAGKDSVLAQYNFSDKYELVDNFSLFLGPHSLKAGVDFISSPNGTTRMDLYQPGKFVFFTDEPFNPANPNTYPFMFQWNANPETIAFKIPYTMLALFVQDSWRISSRFTLNYGLRWNYYNLSGVKEKIGDIRNFNPRFGFSWDPTGEGRSSIRGGIGMYTANLNSQAVAPVLFWKFFDLRIKIFPGYPDPFQRNPFIPVDIQFPAEKGDYEEATVTYPYSLQTSLGYQRVLSRDISVSADLIYSRGYNLLRAKDLNPIIAGTAETTMERPDPSRGSVMVVSCKGKSVYTGLYLTFNKRYSNGWSLDVSYTLSKSMGDNDSMGGDMRIEGGGITSTWSYDPDAWDRAYGRTFFDARHKLTVNGLVNLPLGFQLAGLLFYRSAYPWNAVYANDVNLDGLTPDFYDYHRNSRTGFDAMYMNLRLSKFINISSSFRTQLFAEAYNITNRTNFGTVYNVYGYPQFGKPIDAGDPRLIQFGIRLDWN